MKEKNILKSLVIMITAILLGGIIILLDAEDFLEFPACIVLWFTVGYGATALAHLLALIVYLITDKDHLRMLRLLCTGVLTLISIGWAMHEKRGFMGSLGAAVIGVMFTIPCGAAFLFWLIAAIRQKVSQHSD